jgi:hypothetical protein
VSLLFFGELAAFRFLERDGDRVGLAFVAQITQGDNGKRAIGERGNSLLKTTFKALGNISLCPWKIGTIVAAALVILNTTAQHDHPQRRSVTRKGSLSSPPRVAFDATSFHRRRRGLIPAQQLPNSVSTSASSGPIPDPRT